MIATLHAGKAPIEGAKGASKEAEKAKQASETAQWASPSHFTTGAYKQKIMKPVKVSVPQVHRKP